jgi:predicted site-specific integrase-resolvase
MDDKEYTLPATAVLQIHNVSRTELYRWVKTGKINAVKKGQPLQWHFIPVEVEKLRQERVQLLEVQLAQISESVGDYLERNGYHGN